MEIITELEKHEIEKYSRQFILSQVGLKGQIKLRNAKVLVVGVGGLGSPVLMYLVSSGVGTIGIIDHDIVEIHNLQRQVIHKESFLKKSKIESAVDFAKSLNSNVTIVPFDTKLNAENAEKIIKDFDLVLDCSDNVTVRYILNDFSRILAKDFVAASVLRWEGQLFVFSKNGPCYRCMFPEPNQRVSSCDEAGVMGPACGIIGSMQALEALKIILEQSESMFIIYNMHKNEYKKFAIRKNTPCQVCITKKHIPLAMQPKSGCKTVPNIIPLISWDEFLDKKDKYLLIDVRPKATYEIAHFKSAINVPVKDVQKYIETNKIEKPIALLCKRGITASTAAECFTANGIDAVVIEGGLQEYKQSHCNDFPLI